MKPLQPILLWPYSLPQKLIFKRGMHLLRSFLNAKQRETMPLAKSTSMSPALISIYGKCRRLEQGPCFGHEDKVFQLFREIQDECILPNKFTVIGVLDACASQIALTRGKCMHEHIL